ncbi:T-cell immunomodulatory protein [Liparis tanakae]|uniref:T-cell immunomodulatory protein n=1 Tax=Liparis tanakae TaxID=230148 RepID=A0A4Z2HRI7_9TELE|nr:T-cell immunomodulatory protein [Liparis tanakae]
MLAVSFCVPLVSRLKSLGSYFTDGHIVILVPRGWTRLTLLIPLRSLSRRREDGNFTREEVMPSEPPAKIVGQSSFVDFDGDGYQDHLLPVCMDDTCQHSAIFMAKLGSKEQSQESGFLSERPSLFYLISSAFSTNLCSSFRPVGTTQTFTDVFQWVPVLLDFQQRETIWSFDLLKLTTPLVLHFGDYNLDGFPDALVVLHNTSGRRRQQSLFTVTTSNSSWGLPNPSKANWHTKPPQHVLGLPEVERRKEIRI